MATMSYEHPEIRILEALVVLSGWTRYADLGGAIGYVRGPRTLLTYSDHQSENMVGMTTDADEDITWTSIEDLSIDLRDHSRNPTTTLLRGFTENVFDHLYERSLDRSR